MIIGNKCDMEDKRVIPTERGQEVAKHHGIPFIETSAKTNININKAFYDMTITILEKVN
jgi:Ras-related protein Rab-10